jgi:hypothetical protein
MKVEIGPNLDWISERIARDSNRVVVGGEMMSLTWRASNEVDDGRIVMISLQAEVRNLLAQ